MFVVVKCYICQMKIILLSLATIFTLNSYSQSPSIAELEKSYESIKLSQDRLQSKNILAGLHLEKSVILSQQAFNQRITSAWLLVVGSFIQINASANIPNPTTLTKLSPYIFYIGSFGFSIYAFSRDKKALEELRRAALVLQQPINANP